MDRKNCGLRSWRSFPLVPFSPDSGHCHAGRQQGVFTAPETAGLKGHRNAVALAVIGPL
jgi:hypothetical protein